MTLPGDYFHGLYAASTDPWGFTDRWYEERKRALTLAALPERRYATAFEPGCSIGVLTEGLTARCDDLLASDVSPAALAAATARLMGAHVRLEQRSLPQDWPDGRFDLVVLSELLYYLGDDDLCAVAARAVDAVAPGGTLLSIHWLHPVSDYPQTGDAAQQAVADAARGHLVPSVRHVEADFDLTVHVRAHTDEDPRRVSVAGRDGLC
ncbi:class I SAM-dependent methyltransferase [soil metagenome]